MNKTVTLNDLFPIISEQLNAGGSASFVIHGTSMEPLLHNGKSTVKIIKPRTLPKKYDIIFYRRDDGYFLLHRIVGIKSEGYVCRGDGQTVSEYPVKRDWVIGIMSEYGENGKLKSVESLTQKIYAFFRVNTVFALKIKRKAIDIIKRTVKKDS